MAEKTSTDLVKIGPGLGRRSKIWTIVKKKLSVKSKHLQILTPAELTILDRLTEGTNWMELIPQEWKETYGTMFDTSKTREPIVTKTRDQIVRDVPRTFSLYIEHARYLRLQFPTDMKPYCDALQAMLEVACHQSFGCGYCQGMNFLAATFLLSEGNQRSAFIIMSYLLKQCHLEILYNPKCSSLLEYMEYYEQRLEVHNPTVYHHLQNEEFPPLCYTVEWFTTCFLVSSPGELSACVLDMILCGYDDIMIRVGLALMDHLETVILQSNAEKLQLNFKKMLLLANCVEVMTKALTIPNDNMEGVSRIGFMKLNCETMDPNDEWVNTMQSPCRIHKGSDTLSEEASAKSDPANTVQESCTCSTPPLSTEDLDATPQRAHSVDIGVLSHSHNSPSAAHDKTSDSHTHALLMGHAQSSPEVSKMQDHTIDEDYVPGVMGMSIGEEEEQEHSSVDSPTAPAAHSAHIIAKPHHHSNGQNGHIHGSHGTASALAASSSHAHARSASQLDVGGSYEPAQSHRHRSASHSQAPAHHHNHNHSSSTSAAKSSSSGATKSSTSSRSRSANTDSSVSASSSGSASKTGKTSKEIRRERRPSSASVISAAFKALYK